MYLLHSCSLLYLQYTSRNGSFFPSVFFFEKTSHESFSPFGLQDSFVVPRLHASYIIVLARIRTLIKSTTYLPSAGTGGVRPYPSSLTQACTNACLLDSGISQYTRYYYFQSPVSSQWFIKKTKVYFFQQEAIEPQHSNIANTLIPKYKVHIWASDSQDVSYTSSTEHNTQAPCKHPVPY